MVAGEKKKDREIPPSHLSCTVSENTPGPQGRKPPRRERIGINNPGRHESLAKKNGHATSVVNAT